jgi:putative ABC transport system substrate-binding protein
MGLLLAGAAAYVSVSRERESVALTDAKPVIAVVMTLSHPALDEVRQGVIKSLSDKVTIIDYNAEGSMQSANLIARQISENSRISAVIAVGTLAAQSIAKVEKIKPVVIAAVSDPKALNLDNTNICGLTDTIDPDYQIDKIINLIPGLKNLAVLYSPHESNSAISVQKLKKAAKLKNIKLELIGVYDSQQISSASISACEKNRAVLIPLDNQLVAAMPVITKATKKLSCVIISSNESPIHQGAGIAFGINYTKSGSEAGDIIIAMLNHQKTPEEIKFINPDKPDIYINNLVLQEKNIILNLTNLDYIIAGKDRE